MDRPSRLLLLALVALLVLTAGSWGLAHLDLGAAGLPVALAIAAAKATIVALAFMEIRLASTESRVAVLVCVSFIALLCAGAVADLALR